MKSLAILAVTLVAGCAAGSSAETYGKECGGAFRLYPVDPETALARLNDLRLSD